MYKDYILKKFSEVFFYFHYKQIEYKFLPFKSAKVFDDAMQKLVTNQKLIQIKINNTYNVICIPTPNKFRSIYN